MTSGTQINCEFEKQKIRQLHKQRFATRSVGVRQQKTESEGARDGDGRWGINTDGGEEMDAVTHVLHDCKTVVEAPVSSSGAFAG